MADALQTRKIDITAGPPEGGPLRELWTRLRRPFMAAFWYVRAWWLLHRGVNRPRRWRNPFWTTAWIAVAWTLTLVLLLWGVRGALVVAFHHGSGGTPGWSWGSYNPDLACRTIGTSCGSVNGVVMPVFLLAASTVVFLAWRLWRIRRFYVRRARAEPERLVETAGSLMGDVVGRDLLCTALMNNLRERRTRRPHVVVGKVGSGKTALLVRLAERLAAKGAVPVPVRLRDAGTELDFCALARSRFEQMVEGRARSNGEVDRIWRYLRQRADRIVVLADGLEEALNDEAVKGQRDNIIREAIRKATEEKLPLVIASRPHDPLRAMEAAITELEPLSEEAALRYIAAGGSWRADPQVLDRVVEVADAAESPLYMQIAKDLHTQDRLEPLWTAGGAADPLLCDKWALRKDLLDEWRHALVRGDVRAELPIGQPDRAAVVEYVSALACIGLAEDRLEVGLWELDPSLPPPADARASQDAPGPADDSWNIRVRAHLNSQMDILRARGRRSGGGSSRGGPDGVVPEEEIGINVRLAATWGARMGLVQENGDSVRFQHSVLQAYLGSRYLEAQFAEGSAAEVHRFQAEWARWQREADGDTGGTTGSLKTSPLAAGKRQPSPTASRDCIDQAVRRGGRELLIAFTLHTRSLEGKCACPPDRRHDRCPVATLREMLPRTAARWLDEAESAERIPERREEVSQVRHDERGSLRIRALETYGSALEIAAVETHPDLAELLRSLRDNWGRFGPGEDPAQLRQTKLALMRQCGAVLRLVAADRSTEQAYRPLFEIGAAEPDYHVRAAITREVGTGGLQAFTILRDRFDGELCSGSPATGETAPEEAAPGDVLQPQLPDGHRSEREHRAWQRERETLRSLKGRQRADREASAEKKEWYAKTMNAWVLPLLVDSVPMSRHQKSPREALERLVDSLVEDSRPYDARTPQRRPDASKRAHQALALAQGLKFAANRRMSPRSAGESREFLAKQAQLLLGHSGFWLTRLTLLQALTLWALPDDVTQPQPIRGHGAAPGRQVAEWLGKGEQHPLVEAAGRLAVRALETRRPERFLWIDEAAAAGEVGTEAGTPGEQRFHNLWIPPSTGWSTLDPVAQQLLADVLILVVLGERGYRPKDLFRSLEDTCEECTLPTCLARDRTRLDPARAVERGLQPGDNCTDDCGLKMCPYPAKAERLRLEFSEVFCLRQRDLLRRWQPRSWLYLRFRRQAPWQRRVPIAGMRRFWDHMSARARDATPEDLDGGPC